jgi:outer membrane protein OmpA-like peptidoglycan-associated protein
MTKRMVFALMVFLVLVPVPALARQADETGSKDHPMVPRMTGYHIAGYEALEFASHDFPLPDDKTQSVEGRYWKIVYYLKDGAKQPSALEIARNYRTAFTAKGGQVRLADPDGTTSVIALTQGGGELWFQCYAPGGGSEYTVWIVERAGMGQQVALNAATIAAALAEKGSLALRNILFDTGRATLKPESSKELQLVVDVLKADDALRLEIQGHTDNVGQPAANLTLSQQRAAAVRDYLVKTGGVASSRLTSAGFGDTKPVAPNTTDEGRAQNRRVEIVKK